MKKLLLMVAVAVFGAANLNAQCTPNPAYTNTGIFPDSATNFALACVNVPYQQVITNVVPADTSTTIFGQPVTLSLDSVRIESFSGLPPGTTLQCNVSNCSFPGGQSNCAVISGTPTTPGTYNIIFNLKAYIGGGGAATARSFTLNYYKIIVQSNCTASIITTAQPSFTMLPNPANNQVTIGGLDNDNSIKNISLVNAEGKLIANYAVTGDSLEINTAHLTTGLYFVNIHQENGTQTMKLIKE